MTGGEPEDHVFRPPDSSFADGGRIISKTSGVTLQSFLKREQHSIAEKLAAFRTALAGLLELHGTRCIAIGGSDRPCSHGDATTANVCVNTDSNKANWFDLDMCHRENLSDADRQADDLRALVFSTAVALPAEQFVCLAEECVHPSVSQEVIRSLFRQLTTTWTRPNVFQLAQAPLSFHRYHDLRQTLIGRLEASLPILRENPAFERNRGSGQC